MLVSNNYLIFAMSFCVSYVEIQMNDIKKTSLIRMMKETNIQSQVTSTVAGDDGEAVAKSEQNAKKKVLEKPNEGLEKPADAGWYVAVVRVKRE